MMIIAVLFVLRNVKVTWFVLEGSQASLLEHVCAVMRHCYCALLTFTLDACLHVDRHGSV